MQSFKDFLCWYDNKDLVPTLRAMQNTVEFTATKVLICSSLDVQTSPYLVYLCRHSSTSAKLYHFTESDKDLLLKVREERQKILHVKLFLRRLTLASPQVLEWMLANFTLTQNFNQCLHYKTVHKIRVPCRFAKFEAPSEQI